MNLKKCLAALLTAVLLLSAAGAAAQGITLHTISCFAGPDASDEIYVDILRRYEAETGNTVLDSSSASDETWKTSVLNEFAVGNEPDVLFFFAAGADSRPILSRVVPLEEINREYPEIRLPETEALREEDGSVYAVPVRGYWEGLYVPGTGIPCWKPSGFSGRMRSSRSPSPCRISRTTWRSSPSSRARNRRTSRPGRRPWMKCRNPGWRPCG